ncbi:hypothetical protein [Methylotuvimicrobium sp. KM2]|uniref:hypothetical protein n=1 Tax=Methylotuvimicrobium sp. KM2 TaxID=3133976 RepID=UPI003100EC47
MGRLHQGELEAMILSQELNIDYVILDDLLARRKAQRLGLKVIGTIGLLLFLEKRGSLSADQAWQKLRQLTEQHNMDLSPKLLNQLRVQFLGIQ